MTAPNPPRAVTCASCGVGFACTTDAECWCVAEPYRLRMTDIDAQRDCLCPQCLRRVAQAQQSAIVPTRSGTS
ncbi:MAG: hypothetical protein Q7T81_17715 [Pseudolabrys sp.]|nr:hypothetical protein [Pseudolabrys sp.]